MIFLTEYMTGNSKRAGPRIKADNWSRARRECQDDAFLMSRPNLRVVGMLVREL